MKKYYFAILSLAILFTNCSKNDPKPEVDQEEIGGAKLTFKEVKRVKHNDHYDYENITNADVEVIDFDSKGLPPVGKHVDLEVGKTYELTLSVKDFAGREFSQTLVDRHDIHQVFFLGNPDQSLEYVYADKDANGKPVNVGVKGYLTVLKKTAQSFTFNVILRHLNKGVKEKITANDWNNKDYKKFTGEDDLNLKFDLHLVDEHGH